METRTKKKLLRLMSEHLGVERDDLKDDTPLDDIMDDLDLIEMIMAIEEEFCIELPDDIEEAFASDENPFEKLFYDGSLRGKSEEDALALFKEAAEKSANIHLHKTVKGFLDAIEPYLP